MKKIVLFDTSIGSFNQGDEIINLSIEKNWPELFEKNYIIKMASHTPLYTNFQKYFYKDKIKIIMEADYKFLCGTNALYINMLRPMPNWNIRLWNTSLVQNTICIGVGMGVNGRNVNWYTKMLFKRVLSPDYIHSTRDQATCNFLNSLGFRAVNTGCPTLWGLTPRHCMEISKEKSQSVVFTLTCSNADRTRDKKMIEILVYNYRKVYFWPQCIQDYEYMRSLKVNKNIITIDPNVRSYKKLLLYENIDYVGNRLHGGIFALQHKCRAIIIAIDYRAAEMAKNFSFTCIQRENIEKELDVEINSIWDTKITGLDFEQIRRWKEQFFH